MFEFPGTLVDLSIQSEAKSEEWRTAFSSLVCEFLMDYSFTNCEFIASKNSITISYSNRLQRCKFLRLRLFGNRTSVEMSHPQIPIIQWGHYVWMAFTAHLLALAKRISSHTARFPTSLRTNAGLLVNSPQFTVLLHSCEGLPCSYGRLGKPHKYHFRIDHTFELIDSDPLFDP